MNAVRKEIGSVTDEATLRSLDYHVVIDTSGSTEKASLRISGKNRLWEMREEVTRIASVASRYDSDGITLTQFASGVQQWDGVTADKVDSVFAEIQPGGQTFLAKALRKVGEKVNASSKDSVCFIYTDGEASDREDVVTALRELAKSTKGRPKLGIVIVQVGQDPGASEFLQFLDNELGPKGIPDMVATISEEQSEGLDLGQLVWLAQNA